MRRLIHVLFAFVVLVSACGGGDAAQPADDPATTTAPATTAAPATTQPAPATTTTAPTTTTTTEPALTFASLSPAQQELVDRICKAAADPSNRSQFVGEITMLSVLVGEAGVPALEEAWAEIGQDPTLWDARLEAAVPICTEIGWVALEAAPPTTQVQATAAVTVAIGELSLMGETEGCPPAEILAGEYWIGPNRVDWTDSDGDAWKVSLSVDATGADLAWSFSFSGEGHRLISYHENQSVFEADVTQSTAAFETIFSDSVASISGGWPDTAGTITITCDVNS